MGSAVQDKMHRAVPFTLDTLQNIVYDLSIHRYKRLVNMMHIVVCEDEFYYSDAIVRAIQNWSEASQHPDIRCSVMTSSEDLLDRWKKGMHIDLLFLDIEIPGEMNGMALAQTIRSAGNPLSIVFVTNYDHYVYEGYAVNALRYLRKPVKESEIAACLDAAYKHFRLLAHDTLVLDFGDQHFALKSSDIIYIDSQAHYLRFHLGTTDTVPRLRAKIGDVLPRLPSDLFVQCHRGIVVNLLYIRRFTRSDILLSTGQKIPVSETHFAKLQAEFSRYHQGVRM